MREAVEKSLVDASDEEVDFVALYSVKDQQYSLDRTTGTMLQKVVGYDCEGPAASLGHSVMRVMCANGHLSDVQHMVNESPKNRNAVLTALGRT